VLGQPPVKVQPRKAPVPPSDPPPEEDPDDEPDDDPEDDPEEPPDEDPDDEPELDPEDEPDEDPEDEPDEEPDDDPDDEPEPDPPRPPPPPSGSSPTPALLAQAPNAKAAASMGTPSNQRATIRASVGGRCPPIHEPCPSGAVEIRALRPARGEIPTLTVPRAVRRSPHPKHLPVTR